MHTPSASRRYPRLSIMPVPHRHRDCFEPCQRPIPPIATSGFSPWEQRSHAWVQRALTIMRWRPGTSGGVHRPVGRAHREQPCTAPGTARHGDTSHTVRNITQCNIGTGNRSETETCHTALTTTYICHDVRPALALLDSWQAHSCHDSLQHGRQQLSTTPGMAHLRPGQQPISENTPLEKLELCLQRQHAHLLQNASPARPIPARRTARHNTEAPPPAPAPVVPSITARLPPQP